MTVLKVYSEETSARPSLAFYLSHEECPLLLYLMQEVGQTPPALAAVAMLRPQLARNKSRGRVDTSSDPSTIHPRSQWSRGPIQYQKAD